MIVLSNGTHVAEILCPDTSIVALVMPDERAMTETEWQEYCEVLRARAHFQFFRVGQSWRRRDPDGFGLTVASNRDYSRAVYCAGNMPGSQYDSDCCYCYLGHTHSQEAHDTERLDATGQNYTCCGEEQVPIWAA